jgi:hypothetical protein
MVRATRGTGTSAGRRVRCRLGEGGGPDPQLTAPGPRLCSHGAGLPGALRGRGNGRRRRCVRRARRPAVGRCRLVPPTAPQLLSLSLARRLRRCEEGAGQADRGGGRHQGASPSARAWGDPVCVAQWRAAEAVRTHTGSPGAGGGQVAVRGGRQLAGARDPSADQGAWREEELAVWAYACACSLPGGP